jgi:hypothetical protein
MSILGMLRQFAYKLGPYLMLEALVPGGTLLALLLFLHRSGKLNFEVVPAAQRLARRVRCAAATRAGWRDRTDDTRRAVHGRYWASGASVRTWPNSAMRS